jgi:hypothetical protein
MNAEEYLVFEGKSGYRHEYFDGEVFRPAGGELFVQPRSKRCEFYGSDLRVKPMSLIMFIRNIEFPVKLRIIGKKKP